MTSIEITLLSLWFITIGFQFFNTLTVYVPVLKRLKEIEEKLDAVIYD